MITGYVNGNNEAMISIRVADAEGISHDVDVIIDTGFSGFLTLPSAVIQQLGLSFQQVETYTLADGREVDVEVFSAQVIWHDKFRRIFVVAAESRPLAGMSLMRGSQLHIDATPGGRVIIEAPTR